MPPRSIVVNPDTPSNTLSFTLPAGVSLDVESVLAAIDATAAGPTTALLEIADSSGAVIARKRQSEKIDAGTGQGSATWALRLADDGGSVAPPDLDDYTFVSEQTVANGPWNFLNIPQDARHLILFFEWSGATMLVEINGDSGTNYSTLETIKTSTNGVIAEVSTMAAGVSAFTFNGVGTNVWPTRGFLTFPYYRFRPPSGFMDRSVQAEAWCHFEDPDESGDDVYKSTEAIGYYTPIALGPVFKRALPITRITVFSLSGFGGRASLYKVR